MVFDLWGQAPIRMSLLCFLALLLSYPGEGVFAERLPGGGYSVCEPAMLPFIPHGPMDLNIPTADITFTLVVFFLRVRTPEGSVRENLSCIDWRYV